MTINSYIKQITTKEEGTHSQKKQRVQEENLDLQTTFSCSSISNSSSASSSFICPKYKSTVSVPVKQPRLLQNILASPDVSSTLDRINLSNGKFSVLAAAIARANGEGIGEATLSRETMRRKRSSHRSAICDVVKQDFLNR